ncbi:hypothetical protein GYMLUDRAFT_64598 [Collybiopsis luxurians FD-317 M1]|uniref:Uncharacterized protein n=1 Tax=Collybiopsis luxurians FD-317 M1 TaxID=944289 RepID=A0A0D0BBW3_9AGAR|nr:hypothetical protein GYMLUDRAFT_64598 [Collybiopsis luxurians FD-317 M1]
MDNWNVELSLQTVVKVDHMLCPSPVHVLGYVFNILFCLIHRDHLEIVVHSHSLIQGYFVLVTITVMHKIFNMMDSVECPLHIWRQFVCLSLHGNSSSVDEKDKLLKELLWYDRAERPISAGRNRGKGIHGANANANAESGERSWRKENLDSKEK